MSAKNAIKQAAISWNVYGPLRRAHKWWSGDQWMAQEGTLYRPLISPGDLCFDVGANIGTKSDVFLHLGAKVISFEPQPKCFREMMARCGHNRQFTGINSAVGSREGNLPLYINEWDGASSLVPEWQVGETKEVVTVPVTTLDREIKKYGVPKFCKIDVEGFEWEVLQGLARPIPSLSLEYHLYEKDIEKTIRCVDYLAGFDDIEINITPGVIPKFFWPEWIPYGSFRKLFPAKAPITPWGYGDLFIRYI